MPTFKFKTNIKCSGCMDRVTPVLNGNTGIKKWEVNILEPDKILRVETELTAAEIQRVVEKAGYKAFLLPGNSLE